MFYVFSLTKLENKRAEQILEEPSSSRRGRVAQIMYM
jgi:hypothetical protein